MMRCKSDLQWERSIAFLLTSTSVSTHECCVLSDSLMQQITLLGIKLLCHFFPLYRKLFIIFRHGMLLQKSLKPIWVLLIVHHLFLSGRLYFSLLFLMFSNFTKVCFCIHISVLMFPRSDACFIYQINFPSIKVLNSFCTL